MESMLDNTPSSTKVKKEEKITTTEQVDVSYSQRPAIDKDHFKKLLKNLSEEYNHKITMGEIVYEIMREEKVAEEVLKPEMKELLNFKAPDWSTFLNPVFSLADSVFGHDNSFL